MAASDTLFTNFLNLSGSTADKFGSAGGSSLDQASKFFKSLLGNRADVMRAISPATDATRSAADAAKKEQAEKGTARTGGTAAGNQQIEDEVRKQIGSLIGTMQSNAAGQLSNIGSTELNTMMSALGLGTEAAQKDVESRRQASAAMWSALIGGAGDIAGAFIGRPH